MRSNNRKTIGVFINKSDSFFENSMYSVVQQKGKELGYNVFFFCTVGYRDSINVYDKHESVMFRLAPIKNLDGIIVAPDNYELLGFKDDLFRMLDTCSCPIVCVRCNHPKYNCVYTDEDNAIRPMIAHILDDHKLKNVCFLAGYQGHVDGEKRLKCYIDEMEKHGLPIPEGGIYYGSMWTNGIEEVYKHYFVEMETRPEAIICANDYMARTLINLCLANGIRVPEDVIITGFDNIDDMDTPALSTIGQDYPRMIGEAVMLLDKKIRESELGIESEKESVLMPGNIILRESCGCQKPDINNYVRLTRTMGQRLYNISQREISQTYFSIAMNACSTYQEVHDVIIDKLTDVPSIRDYYMCLFCNRDVPADDPFSFSEELCDSVRLTVAVKDKKDLGMPMTDFEYQNLLPRIANRDEPQAFFVIMLHQRDAIYGYSVIQYDDGKIPTMFYLHWNVIVANALTNIASQRMLRHLYEERRLSSITDHLTGLLNRRGLEEKLSPEWNSMIQEHKSVGFITLDLDDMKIINDTWGHQEGDRALCYTAIAITRAMSPGMLAARMGGDEFMVYLPDATEEKCTAFIHRFETLLNNMTRVDKKPYSILSSSGFYVSDLNEQSQVEACIHASDESMYAVKTKRKMALGRRKEDRARMQAEKEEQK